MSAEQVEGLFEEYARFNMEVNRSTTGTGLGMSITKRLVELMDGEISVTSQPGVGTAFTVRLPQMRIGSENCTAQLMDEKRQERLSGMINTKRASIVREHMPYGSVLVVDDVLSNIYVAKGMLSPYGLKIETAKNGLEVVDLVRDGAEYDVIFMDQMMPKMDGIEATQLLRKMGYTKPIIALTANALVGQSEMFLANGFQGFLPKPMDSRELNEVVNRFIRDVYKNKSV
jgi:CheY-like chemotaxis protein